MGLDNQLDIYLEKDLDTYLGRFIKLPQRSPQEMTETYRSNSLQELVPWLTLNKHRRKWGSPQKYHPDSQQKNRTSMMYGGVMK